MRLRDRFAAGLRSMADGWARDLCVLYGLEAGEELHVAVRRPPGTGDMVEVRVEPPPRPKDRPARPEPTDPAP